MNIEDQTSKDLFLKANKAWGKYTCVKFIKNNKPMDKMLVTDEEDMCLFMRNRTGRGLQIIHVGCGYFGGVVHEVGHALWLDHTHNRHDRDKYLDVDKTSIMIYMEQYKKLRRSQNKNYGIPYDYGSIMHYGSSGPNPTMTPKDRRYHRTMGSPLISFTDLTMVNKHYNCDGVCERNKSAECKNNGFPNPNNCLICVCPSGYGGTLCEDKADFFWKLEMHTLRGILFVFLLLLVSSERGAALRMTVWTRRGDDFDKYMDCMTRCPAYYLGWEDACTKKCEEKFDRKTSEH
ncbi:hypothetical protein Y032_0010g894 [Ancylostoma ceylanicum]|uniref:Metalloendopeptidase n=1 Tax=Ancylostoma ceylanicum TaxID=53326 RepID=A0A016VGB6_9BILA|nr:hypothetical protein Y032_0010g894 [Ancylostoma ceylanicum]